MVADFPATVQALRHFVRPSRSFRSFLRGKIARSHPSCVPFAVLLRRCTCNFLPEITQAWLTRSSVFLQTKENYSSMQSLLRCTGALAAAGFEVPSWEDLHRGKISRRANLQRESCRMAALASHASDGRSSRGVPREATSVRGRVAKIAQTGTSHALLATRTNGKCSTGFVTHRPSLQVRIATLPHSPPAPPSLASLPVSPCVSTVAGVAVLSTPLATTVERARQ